MTLYVVSLFEGSSLTRDDVVSAFPERVYQLGPRVWITSSPLLTAEDVAKRVGIGPTDDKTKTGMVLKANSAYSGYGPRTLWDKLAAWEDST